MRAAPCTAGRPAATRAGTPPRHRRGRRGCPAGERPSNGTPSGGASRRGGHHEEGVRVDDAAAELGGELLRHEDPLVDLPPRTVAQFALLPALGLLAGPQHGSDDHDLVGDAAGLAEEAGAVVLLEMAVEVAREEPVEGAIVEGKRERLPSDELRLRRLLGRDLEHARALIEADDVAAEMSRHEPRAARDVESPRRRELGYPSLELRACLVPPRPPSLRVQPAPEPPVVVLARTGVVVRLHGS